MKLVEYRYESVAFGNLALLVVGVPDRHLCIRHFPGVEESPREACRAAVPLPRTKAGDAKLSLAHTATSIPVVDNIR